MENIVEACTEMIRPVCFGSKGYVVFWTCACEEKILPKSYKYMACMLSESISFAIPLLLCIFVMMKKVINGGSD